MLRRNERNLDNIPAGTLGIIAIDGCPGDKGKGRSFHHYVAP